MLAVSELIEQAPDLCAEMVADQLSFITASRHGDYFILSIDKMAAGRFTLMTVSRETGVVSILDFPHQ